MEKLLNILIKYRIPIVSLILCIFFMLIDSYGNDVMVIFELQWRPWIVKAFFVGFLIFKYIFLGSLAVKVVKWWHAKYIKKPSFIKEIAATAFGVLSLIFVFIMIGWELWGLSGMPKEYIVIRDGKKCVASVIGWLDSSVSCHEYKGLFWMGEDTVSYEIYHRTEDPFDFGAAPYEK